MPTLLASWIALLLASTFAHGETIAGPLRLSVSCSSVTIAQGLTAQCAAKESFFRGSAQPKDVTESVIWSALSGATISNTPGSKGLLTANSPGPAIITASSGSLRASLTVTITPPALLAIDVSPANANIALNEAQQFSATGHYSNATTGPVSVVWSSSAANVADIDTAGGLATPRGPGTTTITATNAASGIFSTAVLNVELAGIIVSPADGSVAKGQQQQFAATGSFTGGGTADVTNAVIWSAAPVSVATISPTGLASTLSQGPATITATSGNTSGNTTLNVGPAIPVGLEVAPATVALLAGKTQQFTATAVYTDGSRVEVTASASWSSSDSSIATVDGAGLAAAKAIGTASIGATYNSFTASGQLQVRPEARFVYALNADETISGWTFDEISGRLRHNGYTYLPGVQGSKTIISDPAGKFLYLANSASGTISAFAITAAGDLARTPLSPFPADMGPQSMAIDPAGKFLYVANQASAPGVISCYLIQTNGDLTPLPQPSTATGNNPAALAAHPSGRFLYSANGGSNNITAYAIAADGDLSALGSAVAATGSSPIAMALDPAGNFLLAANTGGTVRVFKIAGDGALAAAGIAAVGQAPSSIIFDPSGTRVYVATSGSNTISGFDLNPVTGTLTALPGSPFADAGAPSALLMDPVGLYLFASNTAANEIGIFKVNGDGSLSFLRSVRSRSGPASLAATQGARPRHLPMSAEVVSDDSLNGGVRSYSVDPVTGDLFAPHTATTGAQGSFAVTTAARGKFVYTADAQSSSKIYAFALDPVNGTLNAITGSPFEAGNTPNALTAEESNRFLFVTNNIEVLGSPTQTFGRIQSFSVLLNGGLNSLGLPVDDSAAANAIAADPTGRFLYVGNFNDGTNDAVSGFSIAPDTGTLSAIFGSPFSTLRPTAIAIHPNGKFAYVTNGQGIDQVLSFKIDALTGALCCAVADTPVPQNLQGLALDGDGKFLYAVSGSPSTGAPSAVTAFQVDENTGALSQIAASYPIPAGALAAAVDPSGNFLYVAAHDGNQVSVFQINPATGALAGRTDFAVTAPAAIAITESLP